MAFNSVFSELVRGCKLDGSNFTVWKRKIMYLLTAENIDYVIYVPEPESQIMMPVIRKREAICWNMKHGLRIIKRLVYLC